MEGVIRTTSAAAIAIAFVAAALAGAAIAAKPQNVVEWSNGFPSGPHHNLNIHGKKAGFDCSEMEPGGNSVFVPEHGGSEIHYVTNKKKNDAEFTVLAPCGFDDPALVQVPKGEYQVYARILAKPTKGDDTREVVFYPALVEACMDTGEEGFEDAVSCDRSFLMGTGIITEGGAFVMTEHGVERIASTGGGKGKGKSTATDITDMFRWSGYACDQSLDLDDDGRITVADVPEDLNEDGVIDEADLAIFLAESCEAKEDAWVLDIADLVVYGWDYQNKGSKLLQVRFYPTGETDFAE